MMSRTDKPGNLTGIPRKIKDNCAVVFNTVQKWNSLIIQGLQILQKMSEFKVKITNSENTALLCLPEEVQDLKKLLSYSDLLCDIYDELASVVDKLRKVEEQFSVLCRLDQSQEIVFKTWPVIKFQSTIKELTENYHQELSVKKSIKEEFAILEHEDQMTFFKSLWTHQIHVTDRTAFLLESLMQETGFH